MVDPWDRLRDASAEVLGALRAPLPGLDAPPAVAGLVAAGRRLLASPRVRESDAGPRRQHVQASRFLHEPVTVDLQQWTPSRWGRSAFPTLPRVHKSDAGPYS